MDSLEVQESIKGDDVESHIRPAAKITSTISRPMVILTGWNELAIAPKID